MAPTRTSRALSSAALLLSAPYALAAFADDPLAGTCTFTTRWSETCAELRSPPSAPWTAAAMAERCAAAAE
eukprot:CAMPEP_0194266434 /NCGR_PEP_ID=MMETSP0169-20130528/1337_1 /TAXON_ID=218684 /ORGANISM="Corethron pennatum, Strain L29A3" /LENGTH=70 /DNA_ID=CAMNT_0039007111 /DNA_START=56 /DNA_END=265 /DNA_ORIENTATION=+